MVSDWLRAKGVSQSDAIQILFICGADENTAVQMHIHRTAVKQLNLDFPINHAKLRQLLYQASMS